MARFAYDYDAAADLFFFTLLFFHFCFDVLELLFSATICATRATLPPS